MIEKKGSAVLKILIIEDEERLADALSEIMKEAKYFTDVAYTGTDGYDYAMEGAYDVIVLDVMLPGMDGFQIVKEMREQGNQTPVIMLAAKDEVEDKINGLDHGADDYMTKPFVPEELLARIRALSRRKGDVILEEVKYADLQLMLSTNDLWGGVKNIHLSYDYTQYADLIDEILKLLMINPKILISKARLIDKVWGMESDAEDNNVEAYISFLRKKMAFIGSHVDIATVRKVGYKLEEESDD